MSRLGITLEDAAKLAHAWVVNATHFANARQCIEGTCTATAHVAVHSKSCQCHPCATARRILACQAELDRMATAARKGDSAPEPVEQEDSQ